MGLTAEAVNVTKTAIVVRKHVSLNSDREGTAWGAIRGNAREPNPA